MKILTALLIALVISTANISAQSSAFTYQGRLTDAGAGANVPFDFTFKLFAASSGGSQIGLDLLRDDVTVTNGIFTVSLDFGSSPFTSATANYLEIWVRPGTQTGSYTQLLPRAPITSSPYAVQTINASQLGGVAASQYVLTTDPRMTDARTPLAGSADYIQSNPATQQAATSLNIGSNATVGGTISGNIVNATTQFNINNQRVLASNETSGNLFVGHQTGPVTTTGNYNSFVGINAGLSNTTGYLNSFFGAFAGAGNTIGSGNVFLGNSAGGSNTEGYNNVYVGSGAGQNSSTALNNTFFGASAGLLNTTGSQNAFLGMGAGVSNSTGFNNSFVGYASGARNTTGIYNSFVGVESGFESTTGDRNTFVGSVAGRSNTTGGRNSFFGTDAGFSNTTANENAYFGFEAGKNNTIGNSNAFFGTYAGRDNTASNNAFFGYLAGVANTTAPFNSFFGNNAGAANTTGSANAFFGASAGQANVSGVANSFFGSFSGQAHTAGDFNAFFGNSAGFSNTTGHRNAFFGRAAGNTNTTGNNNTIIGFDADVSIGTLTFATAIGSGAVVATSNTVMLGRATDTVQIPGGLNAATLLGTPTANIFNAAMQFNIGGNRILSNPGSGNLFAGVNAGAANTGFNNAFFGLSAGQANTSANNNSFFGARAGFVNDVGNQNSFFGSFAGGDNTTGSSNSFFGTLAGENNTSGTSNSFFGTFAGQGNAVGTHNSFFGLGAGAANTDGFNNTIIGAGANVGSGSLLNATAIGANAVVSSSNTVVLGRNLDTVQVPGSLTTNGRVGVGITASSAHKLHVRNSADDGSGFSYGVLGEALGIAGTKYGVFGRADGGSGNYGVFGLATGAGVNYGVYGNAALGAQNWAGYFQGNTYIDARLGLGTPVPAASLSVRAPGNDSGNNTAVFEAPLIGSNSSHIHYGTTGDWFIRSAASSGKVILQDSGGNVGVGTAAPEHKLHVDGSEILSTGSAAGFKFRNRGSTSFADDWVWYSDANVARFFRAGTGDLLKIDTTGNMAVTKPSGLILRSPDNACWSLNVSNAGVLSTTSATCP